MEVRVAILGQGYVGTTLAVGLERIKAGEIPAWGVPFGFPKDFLREPKLTDIKIVHSIDVDEAKVGKTLYEVAQQYFPNLRIPETLKEVRVSRGIHLGSTRGLPLKARGLEEETSLQDAVERIVSEWEKAKVDVIVNVITTEKGPGIGNWEKLVEAIKKGGEWEGGKLPATYAYYYAAMLYAETVKPVAFANAIPITLARDEAAVNAAAQRNSIVLGDDGASGATPLTSDLLEHLAERNRYVKGVVQFNIGGNLDFLALLDPERNKAKETTKSSIVKDILGYDAPHFIKPTGYLEPLGDKKFVSMHIEYISFNGAVDEMIVNVRINDSPALAGLLVDVIRTAKIALEHGEKGTIYEINAFFMKNPGPAGAKSISRIVAYQLLIDWLLRHEALEKIPRYSVHTFIEDLARLRKLA
ncbi:Myo-inositol-1-phosphate synthase [Pyrolobus fumarii 1A]|uniref:Myo-inositol-1-phosphate synthase n=1 Tax=Pyrolobus fumarii (strain DSM 11204 / 1A) TaxID=694429 RepID=G0EGF5_PYRF1|nr:myo-inositol-1-phosphate synthase [Pyrolobus fumarii]AEM39180.1 Myo-inositol-1-phosphate synthase [Pyrolobus fumarii 1A]